MTETFEFAVIGGGIVGLATARRLQDLHPDARIALFEKESAVSRHQSGRNSGVIHAGIYYAPGSLKARFCREGAAATERYCDEKGIPFERCGKMIVATSSDELSRLEELGKRARSNGLIVQEVDRSALKEAEPRMEGLAALFSPRTGIVDYGEITRQLAQDFTQKGGVLKLGTELISIRETGQEAILNWADGRASVSHIVVSAGLHSDRILKRSGHNPDFQIIPFRGEYFRLQNQPPDLIHHLIYPVPDPQRPFLGVHLTRKLDGGFTVGPNAVLAFGREAYEGGISWRDSAETFAAPEFWKMLAQNIKPAISEGAASLSKRLYLQRVRRYYKDVKLNDLQPYRAGIRAQAVSKNGKLIDDFHFFRTERCLYVANAPSPAATAAFPIADHIVTQLLGGEDEGNRLRS